MGFKSFFSDWGFFGRSNHDQRSNGNSTSLYELYNKISGLFGKKKDLIFAYPEESEQLSAYYLAIRAISEDTAKLPRKVIQEDKDGKKTVVKNSPLHKVLNNGFNPTLDSMSGIETFVKWLQGFGNAYAEIIYNLAGEMEWWVIHPTRVTPVRLPDGSLKYEVIMETGEDGENKTEFFSKERMLHLHGHGDGDIGLSVGEVAAQSNGIALAAQNFANAFFANNLSLGAVLQTDQPLDAPTKKAMRKDWQENYAGAENAGKFPIMDRGFKFVQLQMNSTDAELLNTRKFQIEELARWFRIPPHKLMDMSKSTFNNVEQQNTNYATDSIDPWVVRLEQQLTFRFHRNDNKYVDIDETALIRGDLAARTSFYKEMRMIGVMSGNQIARKEGLQEYEGGDERVLPLNIANTKLSDENLSLKNDLLRIKIEKESAPPEPPPEPEPAPANEPPPEPPEEGPAQNSPGIDPEAVVAAYRPIMINSISRLLRKEKHHHDGVEGKSAQDAKQSLDKFYIRFEKELSSCLKTDADYLCNIIGKDKLDSEQLAEMVKKICNFEKSNDIESQAQKVLNIIVQNVSDMDEAPEFGEVRQAEDGSYKLLTSKGWVEGEFKAS